MNEYAVYGIAVVVGAVGFDFAWQSAKMERKAMSDLEHRLFKVLDELRGAAGILAKSPLDEEESVEWLYQARGLIIRAITRLHEQEGRVTKDYTKLKALIEDYEEGVEKRSKKAEPE